MCNCVSFRNGALPLDRLRLCAFISANKLSFTKIEQEAHYLTFLCFPITFYIVMVMMKIVVPSDEPVVLHRLRHNESSPGTNCSL